MTVSTRSEATSISAAPMDSISTNAFIDALQQRIFAVILCSECQYLEFPGCDVHGALYTEWLTDADAKQHAKCPDCTAATNNARPFRGGCRRCKSPTTVVMWACSLREIQQAIESFPESTEVIEHTVIKCERCLSAIFPRAKGRLTVRRAQEPLAAVNGTPLAVAHFQLSMPHVDGCLRKGMPLQAVAVRLPKSELQFVVERIYKCPIAPRQTGNPQYHPRQMKLVTQQNHLHQTAFRLLLSVIGNFDVNSSTADQPLRQVLAVLEKMEPLVLFSEWSPPRQLSQIIIIPKEVTASSCYDTQHDASKVLENGDSFWRSASKTDHQSSEQDEWMVCRFNSALMLSCIEMEWRADFVPKYFSLSISREEMSYETVAIVTEPTTNSRILIPEGNLVTSFKISMCSSGVPGDTFCLKSIICKQAAHSSIHTPTDVVMQNIQQWLLDAALSSLPEVRNLALVALQKLLLASGSLCGLIQLVTCLVLNTRDTFTTPAADFDRQAWDRLDQLSEDGKYAARVFLYDLAASIQRVMIANDFQSGARYNNVVEQKSWLRENLHTADSTVYNKDAVNSSATSIILLVGRSEILGAVKLRSQLGMIILLMLSELSAWQMERMQMAKGFIGLQELEFMQLEEPFSMEICSDFFAISHRLIASILSRWLPKMKEHLKCDYSPEEGEEKGSDAGSYGGLDVYDALESSLYHFLSDAESLGNVCDFDVLLNGKPAGHSKFSPVGLCVAMLDVITSNLRRLILSKVDRYEIGSTPALVHSEDDLLSAPPALDLTASSLERLITLGTKRSDTFFPVSLKAAAAMEVGTEAFYPSADQRTKILASKMGMGATLEVQVCWPVQERDQDDPRYERLIIMLQIECIKENMRHAIRGNWNFFIHLVVEVPYTRDTEEVLTRHFVPCIQRAGFLSWQVAAGAQELSINLQRHLYWNRVEKMCQDSGAGWIRVYPAVVAAYDEVLADVESFLADHRKDKTEMARP